MDCVGSEIYGSPNWSKKETKNRAIMAPAHKKCASKPSLCMDIVTEVLVRLPVKSLMRFKSVSKSWYDTITSSTFINMHLDHARKPEVTRLSSTLLYVANFSVSSRGIVTLEDLKNDFCTFHSWQLRRLDLPPDDLNLSFDGCSFFPASSCNGLVCLWSYHHILLYNPSTHAHKLIPLMSLCTPRRPSVLNAYRSLYVFGHAPRSNDYKVIRIVDLTSYHGDVEVHIYSLRNNSWKRGCVTSFEFMYSISARISQKFICGGTYVLFASDNDGYNEYNEATIAKYDMDSETYEKITIPNYGNGLPYLEAMDDRLALLVIQSRCLEVWILVEDAAGIEPWTRLFSISHNETIDVSFAHNDYPFAYWNGKIIFLRIGSVNSMLWFDVEERKLVDLGNCRVPVSSCHIIPCISSLVPLE